jgi:undecaprenyl-diphosphatase
MEFLYLLEKIRNPVLDFFFSTVTHLGEETFFLVFAIIFFWCVNKREGYFILITGLFGTVLNQFLKLAFRIDRPWVKDPSFTVVESAVEEATGYSFPSGHTQNIAGTFGAIGAYSKRRWVKITSVTVIVLVALSRMYLGVHTPLDVCVSLVIAAALILVLHPVFSHEDRFHRAMPVIIGISIVGSLALLLYAFLINAEGIDPANLASAKKNGSTLVGCMLGLCLVYPMDRFFIKFKTEGTWYAQLVKLVVGLGLVLAAKEGLRTPLEWMLGNVYVARAARYFIVVAVAGVLWPLSFNFFAKWRVTAIDHFTERIKGKLKGQKQ